MQSGWFVLATMFLRIDGVVTNKKETRYYCLFDGPFVKEVTEIMDNKDPKITCFNLSI